MRMKAFPEQMSMVGHGGKENAQDVNRRHPVRLFMQVRISCRNVADMERLIWRLAGVRGRGAILVSWGQKNF